MDGERSPKRRKFGSDSRNVVDEFVDPEDSEKEIDEDIPIAYNTPSSSSTRKRKQFKYG
jgi:hypothetical protein